jgi:hypothetical protein
MVPEIEMTKDGNLTREQVWLAAWLTVARAETYRDKSVPAAWADRCLEDFDERFTRAIPEVK